MERDDAEQRRHLEQGRGEAGRFHRSERSDLGHAGTEFPGGPLRRRACRHAGGRRLPRHQGHRRHSHCHHGRGRRRGPGDRHPRRVRRAAGTEPGSWRRRAPSAARQWCRPCLRPQPAWRRGDARGHRGQGLAGGAGHQGPGPLLWMPGGGGRGGQDVHGARRRLRRCRCCHLVASGAVFTASTRRIRWRSC